MQRGSGFHHYHKRMRAKKKSNVKKDSSDYFKNWIDKVIYAFAIFGPLITIPQVVKIWFEQDASGISVISWSGYLVAAFFWLLYGFIHNEKPIIITNLICIFMNIAVLAGALVY